MIAGMPMLDLIGSLTAALLTMLVLLYAFGDNPLTRLALYVFIGVAAGYVAGVAVHAVLVPHLFLPLLSGGGEAGLPSLLFRLLLLGLLLTKMSSRTAVIGNPAGAFLVGVGAAVAIGGAIQGTIFPLVSDTSEFFVAKEGTVFLETIFEGSLILVGMVTSLIYFHFGARAKKGQTPVRNRLIHWIGLLGQVFIAITFGTVFAGIYISAVTALTERLFFLWDFINQLIA